MTSIDKELRPGDWAIVVIVAVAVIGILALCFFVQVGVIYLLMNVLLPVLGVHYPLSLLQCVVAWLALVIVKNIVRCMTPSYDSRVGDGM